LGRAIPQRHPAPVSGKEWRLEGAAHSTCPIAHRRTRWFYDPGFEHRQRSLGFRWYRFPMETVIDQAGRIVLPKPIRDALGLLPGTRVDISPYGAGAQVVPAGRTARLVEEDGVLVSAGDTPVDDDVVFALVDAGRK
jgi:AbrB family looped-hinge helix DNA binding protein